MRYIVIILALLASTPTWGQQKYETEQIKEDLRNLRYERAIRHVAYGEVIGLGGSFSEYNTYLDFILLQYGPYWPRPFGLEGAVMEILIKSLGQDKGEEDKRIYSWLPFGIYFPILTFDWPGGDSDLGSVLNLSARAHLLPRYSYRFYGNEGTDDVSHTTSFPQFFDICLEWRGFLHTISVGYRHQTKPFEYECEGWPDGLDMSGVFASVRVSFPGPVIETIKKRLPDRPAKKIEALYYQGKESYTQENFPQAEQKWKQARQIAKSIGASKWEKSLYVNLNRLRTLQSDEQSHEKMLVHYFEAEKRFNKWYLRSAARNWEQSLEIARSVGNKTIECASLSNLGCVYEDLSDYPKAISYHKQALEVYREMETQKGFRANLGKEGIRAVLGNLGIVYSNLGDYPKAISYHKQALEINRKSGDKKGVACNLNSLGGVCQSLGDYPNAISYFEQALEIYRKVEDKKEVGGTGGNLLESFFTALVEASGLEAFDEGKRGVAGSLGNLGLVYENLGDYPKAISYYKQALEICREIDDKDGVGAALGNLGLIYESLGDYPKAISYHKQALGIERLIEDKKGVAGTLGNMGLVYQSLGDYPNAISYFEQALEIKRQIGVPTRIEEGNIADVWLKTGEVQKAEGAYLKLGGSIRLGRLNLAERNYGKAVEYFDKSLKRDLQTRNAAFLFADYAGLGQAYEGLKEYDKARENYEKAVTMAEEQREALAEAEKSKFFVAEVMGFKRIQPYEGMVRVLINAHNPEDAFFCSENLKARVLAEAIARGWSALEHSLPSGLAEEENGYITQIRGLRRQMEALYRNKAMDTYYERERELKAVKAKQQEFIRRLRASYPEYAAIRYPQPIKSDEVKLKPNEVLIEFEVTDGATYVFMLKEGKLKTRRASISRKELQELVLQYRGFFEGITKTSQLLQYKPEVGKKLYTLLFGDLLQPVGEGNTLIIVPDEFLGILPFEALVTDLPAGEKIGDGEYGPFPLGVSYLGDRYLVSYAQSATSLTLLRTLQKGKVSGEGVLVVADPIFSAHDPRLRAIAQTEVSEENLNLMGAISDWKQMGVAGVRGREKPREAASIADEIFPRLEKTGELAREMGSLFGNRAKVLLGADAREDKVVGSSLPEYRYLIFATHGILDNTVPWIREPALVLTQVGNPKGYDGFLTMTEVVALKLEADVVALTACETGVGKNVSGEGVMGMGRAFQFAGASDVLMSLWSPAELPATQFTTAFFKHLREGKEPRQAMRLARGDIRHQGYEHPFYWAAFVLVGR